MKLHFFSNFVGKTKTIKKNNHSSTFWIRIPSLQS